MVSNPFSAVKAAARECLVLQLRLNAIARSTALGGGHRRRRFYCRNFDPLTSHCSLLLACLTIHCAYTYTFVSGITMHLSYI